MTQTANGYIHQLIDNRYFIERKIADGGMASVYEATDQRLNRRVAIKIMHSSLAFSQQADQYRQRFKREAFSAAAIDNPHIVHIYDAGEIDSVGYLVMEFVEGETLRDLIRSRGRFTVAETLKMASQILNGLASAHEKGIIHRDIKPENIMINSHNIVQLADFGLAKSTDNATLAPTGTLLGTASYIPPETAMDNSSSPASDLYSVGLILWEMIVGHTPFMTDNPVTVVYKHVHEDIPHLSELYPQIPQAFGDFVSSLTTRDLARRPHDAIEAEKNLRTLVPRLTQHDLSTKLTDDVVDNGLITKRPGASRPYESPRTNTPSKPPLPRPSKKKTVERHFRPLLWLKNHPMTSMVAAFVCIVLIIVAAVTWWDNFGPGSYNTLPVADDMSCSSSQCTLQGADAKKYESVLKNLSIKYQEKKAYHDTVPQGKIISTDPQYVGEHVPKKNGRVTITISRGIQQLTIPRDIADFDSDNGKSPVKTLKKLGFTNIAHDTKTDEYSTEVPKGAVLRISPQPGSHLARTQKITLVLSKGLKEVTMPDLADMSRAQAIDALAKLKLQASFKEEFSDDVQAGDVVSQSVKAGTKLLWNDKVTVTVSKGKQQVTVPDVTDMAVARARTTLEDLGFTVSVRGSGDTVDDQSLSPGTTVSVTNPNGSAKKIILTTIDDED